MRTRRARWMGGLLVACAVVVCGCSAGPPTGEVSGTIKVDGKPIERGSIAFIPADLKGQTSGGEIKDGRYSVSKVSVGLMKVEIRQPIVVGKKKDYDAPGGKEYALEEESLPAKFNNDSELRLDVKPGKNEKDWDLKKQ